ncbi:MAG: hypothetical protein AB1634_14010 [Thermodesulfobacteriota bacterium]
MTSILPFCKRPVVLAALACLLVVWAGGPARAGVSIAPAFVELDLSEGRPSGQFTITNTGDSEERYRIQAAFFDFSPSGGLLSVPDSDRSLAPMLKFNPKELTLPAKSKQRVRFVVVPQGQLLDQEYWAAMELEALATNTARTTDAAGRTFRLEVSSSIMVPIYARHGQVSFQCDLEDVRLVAAADKVSLESTVNNTGTGHLFLTGTYELLAPGGQRVAEGILGKGYVLPGRVRRFTSRLEVSIPRGEYTVRAVFSAPQLAQPIARELPGRW